MTQPRTIFVAGRPRQRYELWFAAAIFVLCLVGMAVRGPRTDMIALTIALPLALLGLSLISSWSEQDRVREALLDGDVLDLGFAFGRRRQVRLSALSDWKLERITVFSTGRYGTDKVKGAGITVREEPDDPAKPAGKASKRKPAKLKWVFVIDKASIDLDAFRLLAPVAIAELEGKRARQGARGHDFTVLMPDA